MPKKVLILKGLPASGKSTWAKEHIRTRKHFRRINKDELRRMLADHRFGDKFDKVLERDVLELRDRMIEYFIRRGLCVIIDDTNLHPKHEQQIHKLVTRQNLRIMHDYESNEEAREHMYQVEVKFFDVSVKTAIKRDLSRPDSVGSEVIERMYNDFLAPKAQVYDPPRDLPPAIIVDIDGTIAHMVNRGPYDTSKYDEDEFDEVIADIVRAERDKGTAVILCSGRDDTYRDVTEYWLKRHGFEWDAFFMRCAGDRRNDAIIKPELFEQNIRNQWQVKFVLDDRDRVVKAWRHLGLRVLQVADGDF